MTVSNAQVRKLMKEFEKSGRVGHSAMKAGMDRKTARKYLTSGELPSEQTRARTWRTRPDPFECDWSWVESVLSDAPELEAKALFEHLQDQRPDVYEDGQVRTFQRRVRQWRARSGPEREVFFAQQHRPGEAMQTDFTWLTELKLTIGGESWSPLLCHSVLPYSRWESATLCRSESLLSLRTGIQRALVKLGRRPKVHQTDNSTAATHTIATGRRFNASYLELMSHWGMTPRTTAIGAKEQNGSVESLNGVLKRRLKQHLLLRGSRDFTSVKAFEEWLQHALDRANQPRLNKLADELAVMSTFTVKALPEYVEVRPRVSKRSTIRVKYNTYSVPSRLIGETLVVRVHEDRLRVYHGSVFQFEVALLVGRNGHRVDYRHVIHSLVNKPGAFERYRFRDAMFPTLAFRQCYDAIAATGMCTRQVDLAYLRILKVSAETLESEVHTALELLLDGGIIPNAMRVKELVAPATEPPAPPYLQAFRPQLGVYDHLLAEMCA